MVIDVISYNGEAELFDLRYNILSPYVDEFIVVEFDKTFSGKDKPYYFREIENKYDKVRFYPVNESGYENYYEEAKKSPNTEYGKGAEHWVREWAQKESMKDCLTYLNGDDLVYIGDCDEIWAPKFQKGVTIVGGLPTKLKLRVYSYYLNQISNEEFWGTLKSPYYLLKNACLNHLRSGVGTVARTVSHEGWHFTSLKDGLKRKLEDSYTKETYANDWVMDNLELNINNNKDFLGRSFTYQVDESEWPQYLKDNREKYKHLLK